MEYTDQLTAGADESISEPVEAVFFRFNRDDEITQIIADDDRILTNREYFEVCRQLILESWFGENQTTYSTYLSYFLAGLLFLYGKGYRLVMTVKQRYQSIKNRPESFMARFN